MTHSHDEWLLGEFVIGNIVLSHISPSCTSGGKEMVPVRMLLLQNVGTMESITQHSVSSLALVLDNAVKEYSTYGKHK